MAWNNARIVSWDPDNRIGKASWIYMPGAEEEVVVICLDNLDLPAGYYPEKLMIGLEIRVTGHGQWNYDEDAIQGEVVGLDAVQIRDKFHEEWLHHQKFNVCVVGAYKLDYTKNRFRPERIQFPVYLANQGDTDRAFDAYLQTGEGLYKRALWELNQIPNLSYGFSFSPKTDATFEEKYLLMPDVTGDEEAKALFSLLGGSITFNRDGSWDYHVTHTKRAYHDTIHALGKKLGVKPTRYGKWSNYEGNYYLEQKSVTESQRVSVVAE